MIGLILGERYELLEKVGEGGMSEVYKARCNKLNRNVAVKILKKQFADNEEISQKFKREATAIANLSDANIVNVLDVGNQDDIDYIVMEYISGKTLKELIKFKGKLSFNTTINIALQIAKALDCAHKNNIIHRDIKPQNILVTESGEIKVTDFGIAKSVDSKTIINTTSVIGSAHYLSPEQAKGTFIDFRSDIYSFGIVLYEMVTGVLPFEGDSPVSVALKHLQETPVAPKNINTSIPDSLNKLILKAMEKETINRYQNMKEMIQDLNKIKDNPDVIIGKDKEEDQRTIIMAPLNQDIKKKSNDSDYEEDDDYDDEEDYDDDDYDDEDDLKKRKPKNKNKNIKKVLIGIATIIGVLLLGSIGFIIASGGVGSKEVEIPSNIIGMKIDEATKILKDLGLEVEVIGTEKSDKEEGTILKADPKEGTTVKKATVVKVTLSGGEETFIMDDFRDYERTTIEQTLSGKGFTNFTIVEEYNDNIKVGYLISQSPKAGTEIKIDTEIKIVVSKGPEVKFVDVPSVIGKPESEGKSILEEKRLKVTVKYEVTHDKDKDGIILGQSISGTKVQEETTPIEITVGKFEEKEIDVSSLGVKVGQSLFEARARIDAQGLKVDVKGPKDDDAIVTDFTPTVKEGGTVTLTTKKDNPPAEEEEEETPKPTE